MSCTRTFGEESEDLGGFEVAISSGGATAVLGGVGAFLALDLAGITRLRSIGGVSGGAIVSSLKAAGLSTTRLLHLGLDTEFGEHLSIERGFLGSARVLNAFKHNDKYAASHDGKHPSWPITGIYGSDGLGAYIERNVRELGNCNGAWPETYWTMATTKNGSQVFFNKDGVFLFKQDGEMVQLSHEPVPLQTAVRFSCTIPGIMAALQFQDIFMFDGALSRDGLCPIGVLIRSFGADPRKIIACRIGEDNLRPVSGRLHKLARRVWRVHPEFHWGPETAGVIEFRPQIEHVHSLKFALSRDEKWFAILVSLDAALSRLAMEGILTGSRLAEAREIFERIGYWRDAVPAPIGSPQLLSNRVERCLNEHGLF